MQDQATESTALSDSQVDENNLKRVTDADSGWLIVYSDRG